MNRVGNIGKRVMNCFGIWSGSSCKFSIKARAVGSYVQCRGLLRKSRREQSNAGCKSLSYAVVCPLEPWQRLWRHKFSGSDVLHINIRETSKELRLLRLRSFKMKCLHEHGIEIFGYRNLKIWRNRPSTFESQSRLMQSRIIRLL